MRAKGRNPKGGPDEVGVAKRHSTLLAIPKTKNAILGREHTSRVECAFGTRTSSGPPPEAGPWYERAFAADYLARYKHRSDAAARREARFLVMALALPRGARVLDLCCGAGRHARALAAAGYRVTGIDLSRDLLRAARRTTRRGARIQYIRADMRKQPLADASMDGVVSMFTSFGYFDSDVENQRVLNEATRVLKPGAPLVMDYFNLKATLAGLEPYSIKKLGRLRLEERRYFDRKSRRLVKTVRALSHGQPTAGCPWHTVDTFCESVRAYTPRELAAMFRRAGMKVVARYGDLFGAPFDAASSTRCVLVARRVRNIA